MMHTHLLSVQILDSFEGKFSFHKEKQTDHHPLLLDLQNLESTIPFPLDHYHTLHIKQ